MSCRLAHNRLPSFPPPKTDRKDKRGIAKILVNPPIPTYVKDAMTNVHHPEYKSAASYTRNKGELE